MGIKRWQQVNRMGDRLRRFRKMAAGILPGTKGEMGIEPVFEEMMTQFTAIFGVILNFLIQGKNSSNKSR